MTIRKWLTIPWSALFVFMIVNILMRITTIKESYMFRELYPDLYYSNIAYAFLVVISIFILRYYFLSKPIKNNTLQIGNKKFSIILSVISIINWGLILLVSNYALFFRVTTNAILSYVCVITSIILMIYNAPFLIYKEK